MSILNYIYFTVLTCMITAWVSRKTCTIRLLSPFSGKMCVSGVNAFWIIIFATGIIACSANAGIDVSALRMLSVELLLIFGFIKSRNSTQISTTILLYCLFLVWLLYGITYSPSLEYALRVFLKFLYPFLIVLFAAKALRDEIVCLTAALWARKIALLSLIFFMSTSIFHARIDFGIISGMFWYGTALCAAYISMSIFSLGMYFTINRKPRELWYALVFSIPCFAHVLRSSIMGTIIALSIFSLFKYKLKALPVIVCILVFFIICVFFIPQVHNKMFGGQNVAIEQVVERGISQNDIASNGRFNVWNIFMRQLYSGKELKGSGTGASQNKFYTGSSQDGYGTIKVMHSDYIQILCDNGQIGLTLFIFTYLSLIIHCFKEFNNKYNNNTTKLLALTAGSSMAGIAFTFYSENIINYSMAVLTFPYGFYAMMLGLKKAHQNSTLSSNLS